MAENFGWTSATAAAPARRVMAALDEKPEAWYVKRVDNAGLPVEIWYIARTGLLCLCASDEHRTIDAELTPWSEVTGITFSAREATKDRAPLKVTLKVTQPDLSVTSIAWDSTKGQWDAATEFIVAFRDRLRKEAETSPPGRE